VLDESWAQSRTLFAHSFSGPVDSESCLQNKRLIGRKSRLPQGKHGRVQEIGTYQPISQSPEKVHSTLLSLSASDKPDKPYLIGVFGQGGSSTFAASAYSWLLSRRHPDLDDGSGGAVGWTVVKHVFPKGRRDDYFAYLASHPDGRVATLPASAADVIGLKHGTRFAHVKYDFGKTEPARRLYPALNHLLFNPVLPYELYTGPGRPPDPMYGNGYRLSLKAEKDKERILDKSFGPQVITKR